MSLMMPYWHFRGKQNSRGEAYAVTPAALLERAQKFVEANQVGEHAGGATAAAIIAVVTLLHGAIVMIPTFTFSMGWTAQPDPMW